MVNLIVDLMLHWKVHLMVNLKDNKKDAHDVLLDGTLKYEHVSEAESALDDSSEDAPTFELMVKSRLLLRCN